MKRILIALFLTIGLLTMGACANYQTSVDQQAVHEEGGPLTNPKLKNCYGPGEKGRDQFFGEKFRLYPAGPRNWLFDNVNGADTEPFSVYVKSPAVQGEKAGQSIALKMGGEAAMTLTRDCELLKKFDSNWGRKFAAYMTEHDQQTPEGWDTFLSSKFNPALQNGLNYALRNYTYDQIVSDPDIRRKAQDEVAEAAQNELNRSLGEDYFENVKVTLYQPVLPEAIQKNIEQNEAAKQFNTKVQTEIDTMKELVDILGPSGYIQYKALQDGKISVLPVPQGSGVTIPNR